MKRLIIALLCVSSVVLAEIDVDNPLTIVKFLKENSSFQTLSSLLFETRIDSVLNKKGLIGRYTLFAPTDRAFSQFGRLGLLRGKEQENKDRLKEFVHFHLVRNKFSRKKLKSRSRGFKTYAGERLKLDDIGRILYSIDLKNGIIHVIDHVLVNPELEEVLKTK